MKKITPTPCRGLLGAKDRHPVNGVVPFARHYRECCLTKMRGCDVNRVDNLANMADHVLKWRVTGHVTGYEAHELAENATSEAQGLLAEAV